MLTSVTELLKSRCDFCSNPVDRTHSFRSCLVSLEYALPGGFFLLAMGTSDPSRGRPSRPPQWDGCPVPPDSARRVAMSFESVPLEMKINAEFFNNAGRFSIKNAIIDSR